MFNLSKRKSLAQQATILKRSNGVLTTHKKEDFDLTASMRPTNQTSMVVGNLPVTLDMNPTLSGFLFNREEKNLVDIYKDIYYYDIIAGTAADLLSTLPFSDFSLRGLDSKMERPYLESLERLNIHTLLPEISIDYLVFGTFIGSLVFNKDKKIFVDIIPHEFKHCDIKDFPFYGVDPIINVTMPKDAVSILKEDSERVNQIKSNYGSALITRLCEGQIELEPLSTLYIPRRTMTSAEGTSYFRRILPIYFMEKNLYRGSLAESIKRLRSILHITAGDLDWEPSPEDLKFISELFINADNDPIGAIVATRNGVNTNEIRCVSGETLIQTNKGVMKIKDMVSHVPDVLEDGTAFDTNLMVKGVDGDFHEVEHWWYQGYKLTQEVVTQSGIRIRGTENHKLITIENGSYKALPFGKIDKNTWALLDDPELDTKKYGIPASIIKEFLEKRQSHLERNAAGKLCHCFFDDDYDYDDYEKGTITVDTSWKKLFKFRQDRNPDYQFSYEKLESGAYDEHLALLEKISPRLAKTIRLLTIRKPKFEKVVSVTKKAKEHVYDLTMTSTTAPVYVANGILVKNSGGDFWKIEDMWNSTIPAKLKALNLTEAFINGESSVQTMEGSMSGFVEQLRSYRSMLTRKTFYDKLFPLISLTNEFYIDDNAKAEAQKLRSKRNVDLSTLLYQLQDTSSLAIPQVLWEKNLKPEGDSNYLEILKSMTEAGVPVPIRTMAAAGGIKLERVLKEQEEDLATRKKIIEYNNKIAELVPKPPAGGSDSDDYEGYASAIATAYANLPEEHKRKLASSLPTKEQLAKSKRPTFIKRFENQGPDLLHGLTPTGKKKHIFRQTVAQNEVNGKIAQAMKNLQKEGKLL